MPRWFIIAAHQHHTGLSCVSEGDVILARAIARAPSHMGRGRLTRACIHRSRERYYSSTFYITCVVCSSVTNGRHLLRPPYPPNHVFLSVRVLRPCVRVHPCLAQVPAMAVTLCGPPSHPRTFDSPSEFCALAFAFIHVLREFQQWLSRFAAPLPTQERLVLRSSFAPYLVVSVGFRPRSM